jgi:hypothetical protein
MSAKLKDDVLRPSYTDHDGFLLPKGFPIQGFANGLRYEAQANDVFVVTYPKCGTTWMQHLVYLILNDGKPLAPDDKMDFVFPHLEEVGNEFCSTAPLFRGFRLIKTHLPYGMTPQNPKAKYIFVARNPKDCVVSFFHHTRGFVKHYDFSEGRFDVFFDLFLHGKVDFGDYFPTLRSWYDHKDDPNVLFVTYEELRRDTRAGVLSLAEFLDPNVFPARLHQEGDTMDQILLHSSIESMKKDPFRFCSERPKEHPPFIRKGSVGEWDELLSDKQADLLDQRMRESFNDEERDFLGELYV